MTVFRDHEPTVRDAHAREAASDRTRSLLMWTTLAAAVVYTPLAPKVSGRVGMMSV